MIHIRPVGRLVSRMSKTSNVTLGSVPIYACLFYRSRPRWHWSLKPIIYVCLLVLSFQAKVTMEFKTIYLPTLASFTVPDQSDIGV